MGRLKVCSNGSPRGVPKEGRPWKPRVQTSQEVWLQPTCLGPPLSVTVLGHPDTAVRRPRLSLRLGGRGGGWPDLRLAASPPPGQPAGSDRCARLGAWLGTSPLDGLIHTANQSQRRSNKQARTHALPHPETPWLLCHPITALYCRRSGSHAEEVAPGRLSEGRRLSILEEEEDLAGPMGSPLHAVLPGGVLRWLAAPQPSQGRVAFGWSSPRVPRLQEPVAGLKVGQLEGPRTTPGGQI